MTTGDLVAEFLANEPSVGEVEIRIDRRGAREVAIYYGPNRTFCCALAGGWEGQGLNALLVSAFAKYRRQGGPP